jgi:hypothetical protein
MPIHDVPEGIMPEVIAEKNGLECCIWMYTERREDAERQIRLDSTGKVFFD